MNWQTFIFASIGTVLTALLTWAVERITEFLTTKINNARAKYYLGSAVEIISNAVKSTYQTYVEELKVKNSFNLEAQKTALSTAVKLSQEQMSLELKNFLIKNYGDITLWITEQIESTLYDLKKR